MAVKINVPAINKIKQAIKDKETEEQQIKSQITGITDDAAPVLERVQDAIAHINSLWEQEGAPIATIRLGLQEVMKLLHTYEDVVLELEPQDISDIVSSYMALADEETRSIFDKASKKKAKKPAVSKTVKDIMKAAKESSPDDNDSSFLDDLVL